FGGSVAGRTFELFNYFLLALKVEQTLLEANRQLQNGKKVIISIANTLESAFSNIKKDYLSNVPYEVGDVIPNDFTQVLGYLLSSVMRFKYEGEYTNDEGETELIDRKIQILTLTPEQRQSQVTYYKIAKRISDVLNDKFSTLLDEIISNPIGLSLAPIDQIKQSLAISGFSAEEITGRSKYLQFEVTDENMLNLEEGVITRREKKDKVDIINAFNSNAFDCLIINQSGSTGVSMHAVPTTEQGKIVAPVNVVPEVPPTSLEPRNEVKQRAMIILQMELDINKEVQKLGRINRTGQVFPPIYRYIVSAIPSEARLSAMMQKKLKSLMANTSGSQEQGEDMFNSDDLFSKNAVEPFNETVVSLKYSAEYMVKTAEDVYKNTKKFYFVSFEAQQKFYQLLSANLKKHIEQLKEKGQYFGAIEYQEYAAQTKQIIPFIIGNNNAFTEFGGHVFAEMASCQVFDRKNTESDIKRAISLGLSLNANGRV
ncbi:MAG: strawberry notch C-terminal domain-containing protein, partial [Crocinitomicaceae bacterium]|nr:strawberry notch C-terminal domain-containing protein [Crocinitomicaceae bacterium]